MSNDSKDIKDNSKPEDQKVDEKVRELNSDDLDNVSGGVPGRRPTPPQFPPA